MGAGQGEIAARSMVDFLALLLITGAGDSLQGIKKGVMELADAIVINKADGANIRAARDARAETGRALRLLAPVNEGWRTRVLICSALEGRGIAELWEVIEAYRSVAMASGEWRRTRMKQRRAWLHTALEDGLHEAFFGLPAMKAELAQLECRVVAGEVDVTQAAEQLLERLMPRARNERDLT